MTVSIKLHPSARLLDSNVEERGGKRPSWHSKLIGSSTLGPSEAELGVDTSAASAAAHASEIGWSLSPHEAQISAMAYWTDPHPLPSPPPPTHKSERLALNSTESEGGVG